MLANLITVSNLFYIHTFNFLLTTRFFDHKFCRNLVICFEGLDILQQQQCHWLFGFFKTVALLLIAALKPKDIAKLTASEMTATYSDPKGVFNTDDVSNPKLFVYSSIKTPEKIPTSKPAISGSRLKDFE